MQTHQKSASELIELIASRTAASSAVYVYDLAEQVGFGTLTKSWQASAENTAPVISLQTRAGAGLALVGRLSEGTSQDKGAVLSAYTTPAGLTAMIPSLAYLPPASESSRLIIQVPAVTPVGDNYALSPTLASLATTFSLLPDNVTVLVSATPQESIDLAMLSYKLSTSHVIHIFDHYSSSRELGHGHAPTVALKQVATSTIQEAIKWSGYSMFDYAGDKNAHTVFVFVNGPIALSAKAALTDAEGVGILIVRVLRPWDGEALREALPKTVKDIHVFDDVPNETTQGALFIDVFGSLYDPVTSSPSVRSQRTPPSKTQSFLSSPTNFASFLYKLAGVEAPLQSKPSTGKKLLFFNSPKSSLSQVPTAIKDSFAKAVPARLLTDYDIFSKQGGISAHRIILGSSTEGTTSTPLAHIFPLGKEGEADFTGILDFSLLKTHSVLTHAKPGSAVLVVTPWTSEEVLANLSKESLETIVSRELRIYTINATEAASVLSKEVSLPADKVQNFLIHLAFLRLYLGDTATEHTLTKLGVGLLEEESGVNVGKLVSRVISDLVEVEIPASAAEVDPEAKSSPPIKRFEYNAIAVETDDGQTAVNGGWISSWHDAAKHLLFPSAFTPPSTEQTDGEIEEYPQIPNLRPEVPERTFLVTCSVNRRLTPIEYDRNVFHLEFDTSGTGLKYEIGEALGVHGWNDEQEILDFCAWYGVDPNRLVTIPVVTGEEDMHTRTIFQCLQQQIDLFGRPGKQFYTDLADYATSAYDHKALKFIGAPEGSSTFKKLSEKDTVSFCDVLKMYPSARPSIEKLCELIGDIKPRHYSIASAQAVVGNRVDLLVVTVDWLTPSGSPRFGQCTRYLAGLKIGQKVTVSIKPSVMKLPPSYEQPLIMAGLGTGAAPFRAFLQQRALMAEKGVKMGPVYYYFGSRHQSQEYLYGEDIEAYILDGTITKAGLAFSRDGPRKVYIQHLMLEDATELAAALRHQNGAFYLCGPTWPVPDVYEALVGALVKQDGQTAQEAGDFLEGLKEEERYVLEVY
ncbi:assimilatory sulfite reductase [Coniophora puteana RWD-64-598 SS2]|uniref:assimilatory sulfite reductase (NADPH) n=1 Tax=Coniophora puteana (strain RWD-64-598) TaxID=741705 RepID=A0A5M3MTN0_CONPW|nr:assimilatory sulfite reductase [Coniophora puteana RWD-64-598 SS2]EIW82440.1 assimilatory sulfite reductase [Coniophora puteana RWD-64-598 SS2]